MRRSKFLESIEGGRAKGRGNGTVDIVGCTGVTHNSLEMTIPSSAADSMPKNSPFIDIPHLKKDITGRLGVEVDGGGRTDRCQ